MSDRFSMDDVGGAATADFWKAAEHLGELTLFLVSEAVEVPAFNPAEGMKPAGHFRHIIVLSGDNEGDVYDDQTVYGNLGASVAAGSAVLTVGIVTEGMAKPGQSAPYILEDLTPEQFRVAIQWANANTEDDSDGNPLVKVEGF